MKYYPLLVLVCVWCTGCSTYQYATVSSSLSNQNSEAFTAENDSVKIVYAFSGQDGPVEISIYNKLQIPLYVDWSQSALIVDNNRKSYVNKNSTINAELNGTETRWMNSTTQNGTLKGTITSHEVSGFIPPQAWARESQLTLKSDFFKFPNQTTGKEMKRVSGVIVKSVSYSREHSPFSFRSYITISTQADFSAPLHFDHEFWVSEITQTQSAPRNFPIQANRFYIKKTDNTGAYILVGAAGVAAVVFVVVQGTESTKGFPD
jgi:hypothetical protein